MGRDGRLFSKNDAPCLLTCMRTGVHEWPSLSVENGTTLFGFLSERRLHRGMQDTNVVEMNGNRLKNCCWMVSEQVGPVNATGLLLVSGRVHATFQQGVSLGPCLP